MFKLIRQLTIIGLISLILIMQSSIASVNQFKKILVYGDSLSASYGLNINTGWVNLLQNKIKSTYPEWTVINASVSGETTLEGRNRIDSILDTHQPNVLLLELGANDGLQGLPLKNTYINLEYIIKLAQSKDIKILLFNMKIPPNYGSIYTSQFKKIFFRLSKNLSIDSIPFFLHGVAGDPKLTQKDGIHPNEKAQIKILNNVWKYIVDKIEEA